MSVQYVIVESDGETGAKTYCSGPLSLQEANDVVILWNETSRSGKVYFKTLWKNVPNIDKMLMICATLGIPVDVVETHGVQSTIIEQIGI